MRVAVYGRISTTGGRQEAENQLRELRHFVRRKRSEGWKLVGEYVDQASGKSAERPQFKRLFADASEKRFDLVLFWSLDRFSREGVLRSSMNASSLRLPSLLRKF